MRSPSIRSAVRLGVLAGLTFALSADASADVCSGVAPFINEFDYDDNWAGGVQDSDEFVEIAAPAGTDLSGYQVLAVEGNPGGLFGLPCSTGFGAGVGESYFTATIPPGAVIADDTGEGMGFYVVCLTYTSSLISSAGECDTVLPGVATDSNLKNGHLTNGNTYECPDGILLLDPADNMVDAVSYEGIVPDQGPYGSYFDYSAGVDEGFKTSVSFEKNNDVPLRAASASEWQLTGACTNAGLLDFLCVEYTHTPGVLNAGQSLACEPGEMSVPTARPSLLALMALLLAAGGAWRLRARG